MLKTKNNQLKVWQFQKNVLTLHTETKGQSQGNNKKVEKMETKDLEWFKKNLQVVIDGKDSKISELESEISELKSQNKDLMAKNENLKSKILDYQVNVNCLLRICEENNIILKEKSK